MSARTAYRTESVPTGDDPLTVGAALARAATGPFVLYERGGEVLFASGTLVEIVVRGNEIHYRVDGGQHVLPAGADPLAQVGEILRGLRIEGWQACGWAGFELSYLLHGLPDAVGDATLLHLIVPERQVRLADGTATLRAVHADDLAGLTQLVTRPATVTPPARRLLTDGEAGGADYRRAVEAAVADIRAGALQKMILSRVVPVDGHIDLIATYEAGRRANTPARSFVLQLGDLRAAGFSPETVVEVSADGVVSTQPLAGTRALSGDDGMDHALREELLRDAKEVYEHAISVWAVQGELRALCRDGSVGVDEFMTVKERGSVQHLGSRATGRLAPGRNAWHALAGLFPAITVSGVPKAAACASIRRLEDSPRGLYGGAVLTVDADGAMDAALVLRTVFQQHGRTWLRAGAGIVAQSTPEREFEETCEKLRSISRFLVPAQDDQEAPARDRREDPVASLDELRRSVAELVEEDPVSIGDDANLFEIGLESIALMQLVGRWRRAGIEVNFAELAEHPTLTGWSRLLATRMTASAVGTARSALVAPGAQVRAARAVESPDDTLAAADAREPGEGAGAGLPLALMQHAYWVGRGEGQPLGGVAAHLYTEFDGTGVDVARLRTAIDRLIARHDMLRVRISDNGRQVIEATSGWRGLTVHDLRRLDDHQVAARLGEIRDTLSHQMLDIEHGEVFSTALSLLPGGRTRLHLDVDMVAADAVSYRILLADLARLYEQPDADLPPLRYSYGRYRAARADARRAAAERAAEWWRSRLPGLPGAPDLPLELPELRRRGIRTPRVSRRHFLLPADARAALAAASHGRGLTPAMVVATAFAEVLGAWSATPRFVLNVPLFDREPVHPDVQRLVGDFTSSVLLEVDLTDLVAFSERVRRVQARLHADAAYADYSGVEVLRDLTRRTGEQVLAPVVFTSALNLGELFAPAVRSRFGDPVWIISQGPQVLLDAQVTELDGGLLINWDVREEEFAPGVVDAMFTAFERLVRALAVDDPTNADDPASGERTAGVTAWDEPVEGMLPVAQGEVRRRVNDTAGTGPQGFPPGGRLLHEGFFAAAARTPDAPAVLGGRLHGSGDPSLSYRELADRALRVAAALVRLGVRPGDPVGVTLPKGPDQVVAVLGVLAAGGAYVPVGLEQPAARAARIAAVAGFGVVLTREATTAGSPSPSLVTLDTALAATPLGAPVPGSADQPAYVLFTSGSTGEPKGVEIPHRAAMNTIDDLIDRLGLGAGDRTLAVSALDFDLSVFDMFAPLSVGGTVVMVDEEARREAHRWAELIREHRVTVLGCVPALLDMILTTGVDLGGSLRAVLLGGDRVGVDLPARLAAVAPGCRFFGLGGTTETAIHSTICEVPLGPAGPVVPAQWRSVPYGTPLRGVRLRVVDQLGRDCPDHVAGELWIGGDGVANGYRGDPERTADRFVEYRGLRWYRTGDLARYLPDGTVEFLGRRDNQVKIRGFRVELGEVEAALLADPSVQAAVAVLIGGTSRFEGTGAVLAAGVVVGQVPGEPVDGGAVRDAVRHLVPPHMVPDRVVLLDEVPLTANGKVDRRAVAAAAERAGSRPGAGPGLPPRTALERVIAQVWAEALGADQIGVTEEFFALGGDSVLATTVVGRLRAELDTSAVSVRTLLGAPTVAALAERMRQADGDPGRLERVAEIVLEIGALSDGEVESQLGDEAEAADPVVGR